MYICSEQLKFVISHFYLQCLTGRIVSIRACVRESVSVCVCASVHPPTVSGDFCRFILRGGGMEAVIASKYSIYLIVINLPGQPTSFSLADLLFVDNSWTMLFNLVSSTITKMS